MYDWVMTLYSIHRLNTVNQLCPNKNKFKDLGSSHCGTVEMNLTRNHEVEGSIPGLAQRAKDPALP